MPRRKKPEAKDTYKVLVKRTSTWIDTVIEVRTVHDLLMLMHNAGCPVIVQKVPHYDGSSMIERGIDVTALDFEVEIYDDYRE